MFNEQKQEQLKKLARNIDGVFSQDQSIISTSIVFDFITESGIDFDDGVMVDLMAIVYRMAQIDGAKKRTRQIKNLPMI